MDTVQSAFAPEGAHLITMEYFTKDHPYGNHPHFRLLTPLYFLFNSLHSAFFMSNSRSPKIVTQALSYRPMIKGSCGEWTLS